MQKGPSQVTSGNIAPAISAPKKDKDVFVVSGLVVSLAALIGGLWYYSSIEQTTAAVPDRLSGAEVRDALKSNAQPQAIAVSLSSAKEQETGIAINTPGIIHNDIYFEVGRKGLTDEAKSIVQQQAAMLRNDGDLGVLVQGYTDRQGSASYNMMLGMKRAETVKMELVNAGVAEHQIKTVSLGKDGVLCIDNSDLCRQMNRRVHLEIRSIGQEHMTPPVMAETPEPADTTASAQATAAASETSDNVGSVIDSETSPAAAQQDDPNHTALEPASGS
ncbi:hypothetical protein W02_32160 [Nitrospira sp. KM1]|nr:hypothetical protein W02_32160 [Nitrospira sp. KM1]